MSEIHIAIISDLHCTHSSKDLKNLSKLHSDDLGVSENKHPVKALLKLIEESKITAKLLLCPGDIADKADNQGLITGWAYLEKIRRRLSAANLIATVGNHDIKSRDTNVGNVFSELRFLDADYPIPNIGSDKSFWLDGYSMVEFEEVLILNLNTCFYHNNEINAKKSKIEPFQLESIEKALAEKDLTKFQWKIVLCHHHPINHSNISYEDTDILDKGDVFINLVKKYDFQIVIHGHKHDPRLTIYNSIPIFCAGSFSSRENVMELEGNNTFHILSLEGGSKKGNITSWVHSPQDGWKTKLDTRFPCFAGFGYSGCISDLAGEISKWLQAKPQCFSKYGDLDDNFKDLKFLSNELQLELSRELESLHNISFYPAFPNKPDIVSLLVK